jgi:hypothetical protein
MGDKPPTADDALTTSLEEFLIKLVIDNEMIASLY